MDNYSTDDQDTEESDHSVFNIDYFADNQDTDPSQHHSTMTMKSISCTYREMKDKKTHTQAPKERVAHYIRRGFTQKDATAEALLDAKLAQPHTPQTNQEQPPRKETVSINGIRIRRTALIDPTEDDMTPTKKGLR